MYNDVFVEPKIKELNQIHEELTSNIMNQKKSIKEEIEQKKINTFFCDTSENPQFILKQEKKKARLVSAFSVNKVKMSCIEKETRIEEGEEIQ